jgi:VanZ family protein
MLFHSQREKHLWIAAASLVAAIYALLYPMPWVVDFLRDRGLLRLTVAVAFALAGIALAEAVRRTRPGWREILAVAALAPVYALVLQTMRRAEEAFHFLEYGVLGVLVYLALAERFRARGAVAPRWIAPAAIVTTTAAGWLDEGIQYLLPNRYYDLRDVAFNAIAGALAIAAVALRTVARRRDRAA